MNESARNGSRRADGTMTDNLMTLSAQIICEGVHEEWNRMSLKTWKVSYLEAQVAASQDAPKEQAMLGSGEVAG
jgi:hypothetical protein